MRKRRFRHRAPKSLVFPSILLPKSVLSPPFCIPNRSLPLDSAPRMPQAPILSIFDRFPCQKGVPKWLPFWSISGHFRIFIEKVRPLQNMHRRERIACPAVPGSSIFSKFELQKQRRKKSTKSEAIRLMRQVRQVLRWGGAPFREREKQPPDPPHPPNASDTPNVLKHGGGYPKVVRLNAYPSRVIKFP